MASRHRAIAACVPVLVVAAFLGARAVPRASSPVRAVPLGGVTRSATSTVTVEAGRSNTIAWGPAPGASGYRVYRSPARNGPYGALAIVTGGPFVDDPPAPGIWWYRVAPIDRSGREGRASLPASSDHVNLVQRVGPRGGTLAPTTGTIRLEVPAGALHEPTTLTIRQMPSAPAPESGRIIVTRAFEIGPSGTRFRPRATLTLTYALPPGVASLDGREGGEVATRFWDPATRTWAAPRDGSTEQIRGTTVTARIAHLSVWAAASFPMPHGGYSNRTQLCATCHAWHDDRYDNRLLSRPTEVDVCYGCHDGTGATTNVETEFGIGTRVSFHPVPAAKDGVRLVCSDCHAVHQSPDEDAGLLYTPTGPDSFVLSPPGAPIGDAFCYGCHGADSTLPAPYGDRTAFEGSAHAGVTPPNPGTGIACEACHLPHASDYQGLTTAGGEDLCYTCHTADDPETADGSNPYRAFNAAQNEYDGNVRIFHHPVDVAEQENGTRVVECVSCHDAHLATAREPTVDPRDTSTPWTGDVSAFCVTCHVDPDTTQPIPSGRTVPSDVHMVRDDHDRFRASEWASSPHGGAGLGCTSCHDPHGSSNDFLLTERSGLSNYLDRPSDASALEGFCTSCHSGWTPAADHPQDELCTDCHVHGSGLL